MLRVSESDHVALYEREGDEEVSLVLEATHPSEQATDVRVFRPEQPLSPQTSYRIEVVTAWDYSPPALQIEFSTAGGPYDGELSFDGLTHLAIESVPREDYSFCACAQASSRGFATRIWLNYQRESGAAFTRADDGRKSCWGALVWNPS